jgi:hypothetical protein
MTDTEYTKTPETQGHIGSESSMLDHITSLPTLREYRQGRFFSIDHSDDENGFYRDKAQRLARWHRQSRQEVPSKD